MTEPPYFWLGAEAEEALAEWLVRHEAEDESE